jgi:hypothetical protein
LNQDKMGLSNEERIRKANWAANRITSLSTDLEYSHQDFDNYESIKHIDRLKAECLKLVPELFGRSGNSAFWLFGSDLEVTRFGTSLWSMALSDRIRYAMTPEAKTELKSRKKEHKFNEEFSKHDRKYFEIEGYLSGNAAKVFSIHQWCEAFLYATNRYEDDLAEKYFSANSIVAHIMNECFNIFNLEKSYAIAYLKAQIFPKLIGAGEYTTIKDWDPLTTWVIKNYGISRLANFKPEDSSLDIDTLKQWLTDLGEEKNLKCRFEVWGILMTRDICESDKKLEEFKALAKKLGLKWNKEYTKFFETAKKHIEAKKKKESASYQEDKDWEMSQLLERETDSFHFIMNEED